MKNTANYLTILFLTIVLTSCSCSKTVIYYNNINQIDDGEIFGDRLKDFFTKDKRIQVELLNSSYFENELIKVLNLFDKSQNITIFDDNYYDYAFIVNKKDTLFSSKELTSWRFKNKYLKYKSSKKRFLKFFN